MIFRNYCSVVFFNLPDPFYITQKADSIVYNWRRFYHNLKTEFLILVIYYPLDMKSVFIFCIWLILEIKQCISKMFYEGYPYRLMHYILEKKKNFQIRYVAVKCNYFLNSWDIQLLIAHLPNTIWFGFYTLFKKKIPLNLSIIICVYND